MTAPNFFLVGASKSGTTSLYHYLQQHPAVFMSPVKEPFFFAIEDNIQGLDTFSLKAFSSIKNQAIVDAATYKKLFKQVQSEKIIGEASTNYLSIPYVAKKIWQWNPSAKILAILRNPYDALYSNFLMGQRQGRYSGKDFITVLKTEKIQSSNMWALPNLIRKRFYDLQIKQYWTYFPKHQFKIVLYEDLARPHLLMQDIFRFLEVDTQFNPDVSSKYNVGQLSVKKPFFYQLITKVPSVYRNQLSNVLPAVIFDKYMKFRMGISHKKQPVSKCPEEAKLYLTPIFQPHILRLQDMIQRDISTWL